MKYTLSFLAFASSFSFSNAAVLARWTPVSLASDPVLGETYNNSADTPVADESAPNLTVSMLDRIGAAENSSNPGAVWSGAATDGASEISLGDYTTFTLTPTALFAMDLDTVTYTFQTYGFTNPGTYEVFLRSSADGFAADLDTAVLAAGTGTGTVSFDVSSLTGVTEATEMRIYAIAPQGDGRSRWFDLQGSNTETNVGLIVNGDINAVPEPSTVLLSGLAGLFLLRRRR